MIRDKAKGCRFDPVDSVLTGDIGGVEPTSTGKTFLNVDIKRFLTNSLAALTLWRGQMPCTVVARQIAAWAFMWQIVQRYGCMIP